jgi:alpha-amylase/alpha-mannosidase (GH57 family)
MKSEDGRRKTETRRHLLISGLVLVLAGCTQPASETTAVSPTSTTVSVRPDPHFYLNLVWHQHQPRYPLLEDGSVSRPWVRVHATKDYYDMASLVAEYPRVKVTFNLTPILLLQLEELSQGTKDVYWTHTEIAADRLTDEQREFVLARFFDVNPQIIDRFPRFRVLADQRGSGSFTDDDVRDLQVLFNLAWTDPSFLMTEPLAALVEKGEGFTEGDKAVVLGEHQRIIDGVIPLHAQLWEEGRIEVITTPLAHPILPLIADTNLAAIGDPRAILPENRLREVPDAEEHIIVGLDVAERMLGQRPQGMWPGEGSVAELVMWLFSKNGVEWVASGEEVLAQTLELGSFNRNDQELVDHPELLYRPWKVDVTNRDPVSMFFRDGRLSDLIGFEYSGTNSEVAADDFMSRLQAIHDSLEVEDAFAAGQPYVVSVILDGENAWEHYPNDGIDFLRALYQRLNDADWVSTITPNDYLERFEAPEVLPNDVWPGAWFQPNFATWIGEDEEASAWDYLYQVRQDLALAEGDPGYDEAFRQMMFAEGSDWFWWYGSDQESGDDGYFDAAYRDLLGTVYDALGQERPSFLSVPIIPQQPIVADREPVGLVTIVADGSFDDWESAGSYRFNSGALEQLWWAFDTENLYLRLSSPSLTSATIYLSGSGGDRIAISETGVPLGFAASSQREIETDVEVIVPLTELGPLTAGDVVLAKVDAGGAMFPEAGPMAFQVPDISNVAVFLDVTDPTGDDHGPGTYTYPSDAVFTLGSYDLETLSIGTEGDELVITYDMVAPVLNPWGSPRDLSIQTFDLYIDTDPGGGTGARELIDGRNASLASDSGWEFGITVEGWEPAIYLASEDGVVEETRPSFDVVVFGGDGRVVVRIPLSLLGAGDPTSWGYAAAVLSQEGFPSSGVRRVRDVEEASQQFRLGGAPNDANHTRIIDVAWAVAGEQETLLSDYTGTSSLDGLTADDFGTIPLLTP